MKSQSCICEIEKKLEDIIYDIYSTFITNAYHRYGPQKYLKRHSSRNKKYLYTVGLYSAVASVLKLFFIESFSNFISIISKLLLRCVYLVY